MENAIARNPTADQPSPGFKIITKEPCSIGHESPGLPITETVFVFRVVFVANPHHKGLLSRTAVTSPKSNQTKLVEPYAIANH
jgi:hypothetical protein